MNSAATVPKFERNGRFPRQVVHGVLSCRRFPLHPGSTTNHLNISQLCNHRRVVASWMPAPEAYSSPCIRMFSVPWRFRMNMKTLPLPTALPENIFLDTPQAINILHNP
jgi:hypothetical protein